MKKSFLLICLFAFILEPHSSSSQNLNRVRLGDYINTAYDETKPIISYDDQTLFLTRQNHPDNTGGTTDHQDIYVSTLDKKGRWTRPKNIGSPLNNEHPNGISSLSKNGDRALVINVFDETGYSLGASLSVKENGKWSSPKPINIKNFENISDYVDYFETADGNHMFLAIHDQNSIGDQDLYVSKRIDDYNWSEPINLGSTINTKKAEFSPFLSSDNKILFFASYGHKGFGDSDIFYTKRLDDSWTNWSEPVNMGTSVNTSGFEAYFTVPSTGDYAYFVSNYASNSDSKDIFQTFIPKELNPTQGINITGRAIDQYSRAIVDAEIIIQEVEGKKPIKETMTTSGSFKTLLEYGFSYELIAEKDDYISVYQYIKSSRQSNKDQTIELYLVPITVGNTLVSHDVSFLPKTASLDARGIIELQRIKDYMDKYTDIKMHIDSYVNKKDDAKIDTTLSKLRSNKIKDFLVSAGISKNRLGTKGWGGKSPISNSELSLFDQTRESEWVAFTIVADKDNDGIMDNFDKCLDNPGIDENDGCPAIKEEIKEVFREALSGIQFESSSDVLKKSSFDILDNIVRIMKENQGFYLKISGHTDDRGGEEDNQLLSEKRAKATMEYLSNKGVSPDRMKSYGFGESQPTADNGSSAGRAKNRRVEFKVIYDSTKL